MVACLNPRINIYKTKTALPATIISLIRSLNNALRLVILRII